MSWPASKPRRSAVGKSGDAALIPIVDGVELTELVRVFETDSEYEPAGGYAGIVPANFRFGELNAYFMGDDTDAWPRPGVIWLLGCDCGEVGCWPLEPRVTRQGPVVRWSGFRQPYRPDRDYSGFGPFAFDGAEYRSTVAAAISALP